MHAHVDYVFISMYSFSPEAQNERKKRSQCLSFSFTNFDADGWKEGALRLRSFYSTEFDILLMILEIKHFIDAHETSAHETSAFRIHFGTNWVYLFKLHNLAENVFKHKNKSQINLRREMKCNFDA